MNWPAFALDLIARSEAVAMVTLVSVEGSTPRDAGVRMIVSRDSVHGTVGGGNLEFLLIDQARRLIASDIHVLQQDYPLGPLLAQCCGGRVRVLIERLGADSRSWLAQAEQAERTGARYTLEAHIADGRIARAFRPGWGLQQTPAVILFDATNQRAGRTAAWSRIVEHIAPVAAQLVIFGAGHVGRAIMHIAATLPFRVTWIDTRAELAGTPGLTIRDAPIDAVAEAQPGAFFLVLTHAHELDYQLIRAILARGAAAYCGLIGSETKRARFLSRLAKDNVGPAGLTCPIGAAGGVRSKDPACIAVAVSAELLARLEASEAIAAARHTA